MFLVACLLFLEIVHTSTCSMALRIETFEDEFGPLLVIIYFQLYNFLLKKKHANQIISIFIVIVFKKDQESKRFADLRKGKQF